MSAEANQHLQDRDTNPRLTSLASLQPLSWSFNQIKQVGAATDTPPVTFAPMDDKHKSNPDAYFKFLKPSSTSPHLLQLRQMETQDTEMLDVPVTNKIFSINGKTKNATQVTTLSCQDSPVVWVDDDGEFVEVTRSRLRDAELGRVRTNENLTQPSTSSDSLRQASMDKRASEISDSHWYRDSRLQCYPEVYQNQEFSVASPSSSISSREPDVQILDAAIARNFPVYQKLKPGPSDYLSDIDFAQGMKANSLTSPLEIDEDDEAVPEDFASENFIVDHLRSLVISTPKDSSSSPERRNVRLPKSEVRVAKHKGLHLQTGVTVELHNGSFLRIESVWRESCDLITIKGYRLVRYEDCGPKLPDRSLCELVWVNEVDEDLHRAGVESVLEEEPVANLKRVRNVIYTNRPWPEVSYARDLENKGFRQGDVDRTALKENETLYCRWKYIEVQSRFKTDAEACLTLLDEDEARGVGRLRASDVRKQWRGGKGPAPGGSSTRPVFNVETREMTSLRKYSTGDCFCGAGGISRGAIQAGLHVAWGFDKDEHAIETHKKNFAKHGTASLAMNDAQFLHLISDRPGEYTIDHAHYSPPCQPFSAANHNRNVEGDFVNQKALFSLHHLTERLKPRIATIEETAGLMSRHKQWFDTLVNIFTSIGYSVRWKIVRCQDYGIPQTRARLLLTAAA